MVNLKVDGAPELPGPFEILELADGETRTFSVGQWEVGRMTIEPRDGRPAKELVALRVHVGPEDKATIPQYWDITAQHLIAGLVPYLERGPIFGQVFTVTKHGEGPRARFTLDVGPR